MSNSHPESRAPDSINELVIVGDFGFHRNEGPWTVEKEGTKWTVIIPYDRMDRTPSSRQEGCGAVLIADGQAVGGGLVDTVFDPQDEGEIHIVVDQYARGDPTETPLGWGGDPEHGDTDSFRAKKRYCTGCEKFVSGPLFKEEHEGHDPDSQTRVGHCKQDETDVYVGRGPYGRHMESTPHIHQRGWLGNPYPVENYGREESLRRFRESFRHRLGYDSDFREAVGELAGSALGCWCQRIDEDEPSCHAEIIAEYADRIDRDGEGLA